MKQDIAKRWVEALRSGEYEQAQEVLKGSSGFCCLGVLCDLHSKETGAKFEPILGTTYFSYMGVDGYLPREVQEWAGMQTPSGEMPSLEDKSLTDLNDVGDSFETIADTIEKHVEEL